MPLFAQARLHLTFGSEGEVETPAHLECKRDFYSLVTSLAGSSARLPASQGSLPVCSRAARGIRDALATSISGVPSSSAVSRFFQTMSEYFRQNLFAPMEVSWHPTVATQ